MSSDTPDIVIDFSPQGQAQAMHFDTFALGFLGDKKVTRATEIHHNEQTQLWDIILPGCDVPCCPEVTGFDGYDVARRFEVLWLQEARMLAVAPESQEGIAVAIRLRNTP